MLLSIIIPAHNEEKTLFDIIQKVIAVPIQKEIVVINDGSTDSTPEILNQLKRDEKVSEFFLGFTVIHKKNGGKGSALKAGVSAAKGDIILFQDADLEYEPNDYHLLVDPIRSEKTHVVIGSRMGDKKNNYWVGGRPSFQYLKNHLGIRVINVLTNLLYQDNKTDVMGCYKAFNAKLIKSIPIESNGFEYDNELMCKIYRLGHRIQEVPVHYYPRSYEEGKKIHPRDGFIILWTILKWRFKKVKK